MSLFIFEATFEQFMDIPEHEKVVEINAPNLTAAERILQNEYPTVISWRVREPEASAQKLHGAVSTARPFDAQFVNQQSNPGAPAFWPIES